VLVALGAVLAVTVGGLLAGLLTRLGGRLSTELENDRKPIPARRQHLDHPRRFRVGLRC